MTARAADAIDHLAVVADDARMSLIRRWAWPLFTTIAVIGIGWLAADAVGSAMTAPKTPTTLTLAQAQAMSPLPRWLELTHVVVRCDLVRLANKVDVVPVIDVDDTSPVPAALWISLEKDELCSTVPSPVRVVQRNSGAFREAVMQDLHASGVVVGGTVYALEDNLPMHVLGNVVGSLVALFCALFALAFQLRGRLQRRRHEGLRAVGDAGAAPAGGVLAAIVSGSRVDGADSVLPPAPLLVSSWSSSQAFRAKYIGPALLVVSSIAMTALGGWATVGIVNDLRAWHQGVEVPAELKGSTTTKLIVSFLDIQLAWQMPGETAIRHDNRFFMTLWMPDDNAGAVRALVADPSVATFEEAVDLVPLRAPLVLALFGFSIGALVSARNQRRQADHVLRIAETAVEARLVDPTIVAQTHNGAVTGYTLSGVLEGVPVTTTLAASVHPDQLVFADDTGALLVARSADGSGWVPIRVDGEPFAWRGADLARAQAVLVARGSPSVLVEPAL